MANWLKAEDVKHLLKDEDEFERNAMALYDNTSFLSVIDACALGSFDLFVTCRS